MLKTQAAFRAWYVTSAQVYEKEFLHMQTSMSYGAQLLRRSMADLDLLLTKGSLTRRDREIVRHHRDRLNAKQRRIERRFNAAI